MLIKFYRKLPEEHWVNQPSAVSFDLMNTRIIIFPKDLMLIVTAMTGGLFLLQQDLI